MAEKKDFVINGVGETPKETISVEPMSQALLLFSQYLTVLKDYHAVKDPDLESLADLITRAKGPFRSMRRFAEDVGVSPATMSRIMNQKTAGPLNNELLAKIAANADKQSGVTMEMLLAANGEAKKGSRTVASCFEEMCIKAILDELVARGFSITKGPSKIRKGPAFGMQFDLELETNAIGPDAGKNRKWLFEFKSGGTAIVDGVHPSVGYSRFRQWLTMTMSLYYCGTADADRISYVTDRRDMYEQAKKALEKVCIPDEISAILVQGGAVIEEYVAPTRRSKPRTVLGKRERVGEKISEEEPAWDMDAFSVGNSHADDSTGQSAGGVDGD